MIKRYRGRKHVEAALNREQRLTERRQLHQVIFRHRFQRVPGFAPCRQSSDDHERVESFFPQQMRHPGAGRFARSSTVKINVLILGNILDLFLKVVGFNANRPTNALRAPVIVSVAADVHDQHPA